MKNQIVMSAVKMVTKYAKPIIILKEIVSFTAKKLLHIFALKTDQKPAQTTTFQKVNAVLTVPSPPSTLATRMVLKSAIHTNSLREIAPYSAKLMKTIGAPCKEARSATMRLLTLKKDCKKANIVVYAGIGGGVAEFIIVLISLITCHLGMQTENQ